MLIRPLAALAALSLISACAGQVGGPPPQPAMTQTYSNSVGFTGIDGEPHPLLDY